MQTWVPFAVAGVVVVGGFVVVSALNSRSEAQLLQQRAMQDANSPGSQVNFNQAISAGASIVNSIAGAISSANRQNSAQQQAAASNPHGDGSTGQFALSGGNVNEDVLWQYATPEQRGASANNGAR